LTLKPRGNRGLGLVTAQNKTLFQSIPLFVDLDFDHDILQTTTVGFNGPCH
jgi:hypothetical protein